MRAKWGSAALGLVFASGACTLLVDTDELTSPTADSPAPRDDSGTTTTPPPSEAGVAETSTNESGLVADRYRDEVMMDEPSAYWRLAEPGSTSAAKDEVAGHDGVYVGVELGADGPAPGHKSARFNGQNAHVTVAYRFSFSYVVPFSVEAWVAADGVALKGCHHVFTVQERGSPKRGFALLYYWGGDPGLLPDGMMYERFASNEGRNSRQGDGFLPPEGAFAHVVGTYDGKSSRLYVDGVLKQVGSMDARALGTFEPPTFIGTGSDAPGDCYWSGRIAEVAVYEKAITPERIAAHFAAMPK